jgi:glyoxylase-like metal-dependent hydrolase (beta-lactamase superfamily II)
MAMIVHSFALGPFLTNCHVASCKSTLEAIVIDPSFDGESEAQKVFEAIEKNRLTLKFIVNTHGHPDHTCGNGLAKERFHVPILIHEGDSYMLGKLGRKMAESFGFKSSSPPPDKPLHEGDVIKIGKTSLKVIHTPGHSRGSISLLGEGQVFTGDALFVGSIGRTDFPEGSEPEMLASLKKLAFLPDELLVYTGHGSATTMGDEKRFNPFLQQMDS